MKITLVPRAAPPHCLRLWIGILASQAPMLTWRLDNMPLNDERVQPLRPLGSAVPDELLGERPAENFTGVFEISGRSLPEDASAFFDPVIDWIREYKKDPNSTTEFYFRMEYFNTASSKYIQDLIAVLEGISNIHIIWCYEADDETMEEAGQEFSEMYQVPFELRSF